LSSGLVERVGSVGARSRDDIAQPRANPPRVPTPRPPKQLGFCVLLLQPSSVLEGDSRRASAGCRRAVASPALTKATRHHFPARMQRNATIIELLPSPSGFGWIAPGFGGSHDALSIKSQHDARRPLRSTAGCSWMLPSRGTRHEKPACRSGAEGEHMRISKWG
jgi:hypothetical protein